jgi:hypothetical protein
MLFPSKKAISAIYLKIFRIFKKLKLRNRESKVRNVGSIAGIERKTQTRSEDWKIAKK